MRPIFSILIVLAAGPALAQRIVTIAGMGPSHRAEVDGQTALTAPLNFVYGLTVDRASGRLIFHDEGLIERLEADGTLIAVAGARNRGDADSADGTPASALRISILRGMTEDASGALYFSDAGVGRVFRMGSDGRVTTVAGGPGGGVSSPRGLVFDSKGNLFFADVGCHCIHRLAPDGTLSSFFTLPPATRLQYFEGLAIDARDNLYAAEFAGHQVWRIAADETAAVLAGTGVPGYSGDGGPALAAQLQGPSGVAVTADGTLYIADTLNQRIRKVTPDGTISTIAGTGATGFAGDGGPAAAAQLNWPAQILVAADGTIDFTDYRNRRVRRITPDGTIGTLAGSGVPSTIGQPQAVGDGGPAITAAFRVAAGVAFDAAGRLLISDVFDNRIRRIETDGTIDTIATVAAPFETVLDTAGGMYVPKGNSQIVRIDGDGTVRLVAGKGTGNGLVRSQGDGGPATEATLNEPRSVALDASGNLWIADLSNARLRVVDTQGIIRTASGPGVLGGEYWNVVAIDPQGAVYVVIAHLEPPRVWSEIDRVNNDGSLTRVGGNGQGCGESLPSWAYDGRALQDVPLCVPIGMYFHGGSLYIPESYYEAVLRVGPDGIVTRVAGTNQAQAVGDGGPALNANFGIANGYFSPSSVAIDGAGNLFIGAADRVREVTTTALVGQVTPSQVNFTASGSQKLAVQTNFAEPFPYTVRLAAAGGAWLSANRSSGVTGEALTLTADAKGLAAGTYAATVTVQIATADPVSVIVPVTLTVK